MNKVELKEIAGGALQEKFEKAFEKVIENLQDVNTSFKVKRKIQIDLSFVQNETRDDVVVGVSVTEKLAPQAPTTTSFSIGKDLESGAIYAEEYGRHIKGQVVLDEKPKTQVIDGDVVDTETGEVIKERENIIDYRKAAQ